MKKIIFLKLFIITTVVFSQQNNRFNKFAHLSTIEGLSQNSVFAFEQDDLGQIWIGTRDGLNKYDGEKIKIFRNNIQDSTSISNNDIRCILKDKEGSLWIGTQKGLNRYDLKKEHFTNFFYSSERNSISDNQITSIAQLQNGDIWIGTTNGLSIYDNESHKFINYRFNELNKFSLSDNYINQIYQDKNNTIWIGTTNGLNKVISKDKLNLKFQHFFLPASISSTKGIFQTIEGNPKNTFLWIGTKNNGLLIFDTNENVFKKVDSIMSDKIISKDIRSMAYDKEGNLWLATYDGLFVVNNTNVEHITNQYGNPKSLSRNTLKKVFVDKEGSVWIGAYYGGANVWNSSSQNFDKVYKFKGKQAYPLGVVSSIEEDSESNLFFGTENDGITVLKKDKSINLELTSSLNKKLGKANVKSLFVDGDKLWIATYNNGFKCFDIKLKKFDNLLNSDFEIVKLLENVNIYAITRIEHLIIFGTFGEGLVIYDQQTKQTKQIKSSLYQSNTLSNNRVRVLFADKSKNLWIGTESGLNKISYSDLNTEKFNVQRYLFDNERYFGSDVASIIETKLADNIYVGTKEKGLFVLNNNQFEPLELETKTNKVNNICTILEGERGHLWISSNLGVIKFNTKSKEIEIYNSEEGLLGQEFNNNSGKKISSGNVYFGGVFGATVFDPSFVNKKNDAPKVILTNLKVEGNDIVDYDYKNSILKQSISYTEEIQLKHNQSSFSLNFSMPSYADFSNKKYKYRLIGLDESWKYSNTPEINYSIQKSGDFIFEVAGAFDDSTPPTRLQIKVLPPPWKTPLAFIVYFVIIALALYGLNSVKESRSKLNHKLQLQQIEKQQQEELNKSKLEFFTNISHEFRTPLSLILGPLQQVLDEYQGSNKIYKKLLVIQQNGDQLLKLINQLLDFRKFENKHSKLSVAEGNIVKFIREIYLSFYEFSKIGNYKYEFNASDDVIKLYFDRNKLERVFYNLISNAFKYTPEGGKIEINIFFEENSVVIQVKDNGKGIDKQFVNKVFDRFYEVASDEKYQKQFNQASGIGLSIAKKAIDLHKGRIEVLETEEQGSTFVVNLPLGKAHLKDDDIIKNFKISDDVRLYENQIKTYNNKDLGIDLINQNLEKQLILVAEDNDGLRDFIADVLKERYNVITASNGKEAYVKVLQQNPDLIISDVIMPEMEGTELCAKIKSDIRTSHIPLILLTSRTSLVYKFDGLESGADAYINKPFNVKEFLLTVNNILDSKQKIKQKYSGNTVEFENSSATSIDEKMLNKAVNIVKKNIDNNSFNIPSFSAELGVSRTILFAKIKSLTNLTPNEFIHSIRMKRAAELLELGQINVSEVCYKVGFKDPKYFTKCFKKHFNQTPSEYSSKFYI